MTDHTLTTGYGISRLLSGTRLDPRGSTGFSIIVIVMVLIVGMAGALASFEGQMAVAGWALLPITVVVPIVIDGSIVVFSLAAILQRSRGQSTFVSWMFVGIFTSISIAANCLHVLIESPSSDGALVLQVISGAFVAGIMPISIWLVTHVLTDLLVEKPTLSRDEIQQQIVQEVEAEAAERDRIAKLAQAQELARENERRRRQLKADDKAEWARIKDSPDSKVNGTPDRQLFIERVLATYSAQRDNASRTAELLEITYQRVLTVVRDYEFVTK